MNLKQLNLPTLEELEQMTDEDIAKRFEPFLVITRPPEGSKPAVVKKKPSAKKSLATTSEKSELEKMAANMGFNIKL